MNYAKWYLYVHMQTWVFLQLYIMLFINIGTYDIFKNFKITIKIFVNISIILFKILQYVKFIFQYNWTASQLFPF